MACMAGLRCQTVLLTAAMLVLTAAAGAGLTPKPTPDAPPDWMWDTYHDHDEITSYLAWLNASFPALVHVVEVGRSSLGRPLLAARLTGHRSTSLLWKRKPRVKIVAGIHGDEAACPELLLRLLGYLASRYSDHGRCASLLDAVELHALPVMNPDGRAAGKRLNAAGYDLNRNFPLDQMPYAAPGPESTSDSDTVRAWRETGCCETQPEVAAVMEWSRQVDFTLSASLHQGALVASYPYDSCDTQGLERSCPTEEDPLPSWLARVYSFNHGTMHGNSNGSFTNGTVQGATWYTLLGGMQDWVFFDRQSLELTLELAEDKRPDPADLPALWAQNKPALLRFAEMALLELRGRLVDARSFAPLSGHIEVSYPQGHRGQSLPHDGGEFEMLLAPDVLYCLTIQPAHPEHPRRRYEPIHVSVLRLGGDRLLRGHGVHGLGEKHVFFAFSSERGWGSWMRALQLRIIGTLLWGSSRAAWRGDEVLLGSATAGACAAVREQAMLGKVPPA